MSFVLTTATKITQSGTDADLSGLAGIAGVVVEGGALQTVYTIPDTVTLTLTGELNINPDTELLFFANTVQYTNQQELRQESGSTLNINGSTAVTWQTDPLYSRTTFLRFNRDNTGASGTGAQNACWYLDGNATLNWVGGSAIGAPVVYWNGTHKLIEGRWIGITASYGMMFRIRGTIPTDGFKNFFISSHRTVIDVSATTTFDRLSTVNSLTEGRDRRIFTNFNGQNEYDTWTRNGYTRTYINNTTGMNLRVDAFTNSTTQRGGQIPVYKDYVLNIVDGEKTPLVGAETRVLTYDDGNRINYPALPNAVDEELTFIDLTSIEDSFATSDALGQVTGQKLLKTWTARIPATEPTGNTISRFCKYPLDAVKQDKSFVDVVSVTYLQSLIVYEVNFNGAEVLEQDITMFPDFVVTEQDVAVTNAYATIDTPAEFYDRAKAYLVGNLGTNLAHIVGREGNLLNAGAYNVAIDPVAAAPFALVGNTITIKSSNFVGDMTTTGLITLLNGAAFTGIRTDANGTVYPNLNISISGISAGSRLYVFNETTSTEVVNEVVAGTTYIESYPEGTGYSAGDVIKIRLTKTDGVTAKLGYETVTVASSLGWSALVSQVDDTVYGLLGVDGSLVNKFQADYINLEVDLTIAADFTVAEVYAWWSYNLTTESGIRNFFGGLTALDLANFRIDTGVVDLRLDNTTNVSVIQTDNRRLYRSDELYPVKSPTTSGYGLDVVWRNTVLVTGLTTAQETKLFSLDTDNLDAAVSTRSTFDPDADVVANVALVDTVTANTDMRGTDGASTFDPAIDDVTTDTASRDASKADLTALEADVTSIKTNTGLIPALL